MLNQTSKEILWKPNIIREYIEDQSHKGNMTENWRNTENE